MAFKINSPAPSAAGASSGPAPAIPLTTPKPATPLTTPKPAYSPRPARPMPSRDRNFKEDKDSVRLNERIRVPQVRLIDQNGEQVGIVATTQALQMARDANLDLMEISPNAQPPVCKICDYGKFKYEKKKKDHQARKKQVVVKVKEVQLRPNTDQHDLDYKIKNSHEFLVEGDKVKFTILFRGREIAHTQPGFLMCKEVVERLKEVGIVEAPPKLEGKKLIMILGPNPAAKKK